MKQDEILTGVDLSTYERMKLDGLSPHDVLANAWKADLGPGRCVRLMMVIFGVSIREGLDILGEAHQKYPDLKPYEGEFYS
jgi:hypothetical protein